MCMILITLNRLHRVFDAASIVFPNTLSCWHARFYEYTFFRDVKFTLIPGILYFVDVYN